VMKFQTTIQHQEVAVLKESSKEINYFTVFWNKHDSFWRTIVGALFVKKNKKF